MNIVYGNTQGNIVINFLDWYEKEYDNVYSIGLLNTDGRYKVNEDGCKKYIELLKSSGYILDNYLKYWANKFEDYKKYYENEYIDDGLSDDFDYDLVLLTQEQDYMLDLINSIKNTANI